MKHYIVSKFLGNKFVLSFTSQTKLIKGREFVHENWMFSPHQCRRCEKLSYCWHFSHSNNRPWEDPARSGDGQACFTTICSHSKSTTNMHSPSETSMLRGIEWLVNARSSGCRRWNVEDTPVAGKVDLSFVRQATMGRLTQLGRRCTWRM